MNIEVKDIPVKVVALLHRLKKYSLFICILLVLGLYVFLVLQIRHLASVEPTSADVINKVNELNTPKLDQDAVDRIQQLSTQNVEVKALFEGARQNPFQE